MSGLEPLAALGLACNVFQVLSFAGDVCKYSKSIFEHGQAPESAIALARTSESLAKAFNDAEAIATANPQPLAQSDHELLKIARECNSAAKSLRDEVDNTAKTAGAKGKLVESVIMGVQSVTSSRRKKVKELERLLQTHRDTLETRLLVNICSRTDAINISQRHDFNNLGSTLRSFIQSLSQGNTRIADLVAQDSKSTREHISKEMESLAREATVERLGADSRAAHENVYKAVREVNDHYVASDLEAARNSSRERLLQSLKYTTVNERRNQIKDPHVKTFEWIFKNPVGPGDDVDDEDDEDSKDTYMFNKYELVEHNIRVRTASRNFCQWLQTPDADLFWICGKAGSGKSTLMKFLADHPRTLEILDRSKTTAELGFGVSSHFIWSSGARMEAKIKGCLCSLVHQLINSDLRYSEDVLRKFPDTRNKDNTSDWSEKALKEVLYFLLRNSSRPHCFFIDGLDEIDPLDGQPWLIELLKELRSIPHLKLCASSRPEPALRQYLTHCPMFEIQDLTFADIWHLTSHTLRKEFPETNRDSDKTKYRQLVSDVCTTADGVFLWVALALRSLQSGLCRGDDFDELRRRLQSLPKDLKNLYKTMWSRLGDDEELYRKEAATFFNLILTRDSQRDLYIQDVEDAPLELLLATDTTLADEALRQDSHSPIPLEDLKERCATIARRVDTRCAGLLEVIRRPAPIYRHQGGTSTSIRFIHRSAKDFLELEEEGQRLLAQDKSTKEGRNFNFTKAHLAIVCLCSRVHCKLPAPYYSLMPLEVLMNVGRLLTGTLISHHHAHQLVALVELLVPGSVGDSVWGQPPFNRGCQVHVDFLGLAVHTRKLGFFREAIQRKKDANPTALLSPAYRSYLFIQTMELTHDGLFPGSDGSCTNIANWLLEDGPVCPTLRTFPSICGVYEVVESFFVPCTAISVAITHACRVLTVRSTQTQVLNIIKALLRQVNIGNALSNPILLRFRLNDKDDVTHSLEIMISPSFGSIARCLIVEADAKFMLRFLLDFMDKHEENHQLSQEVHTALDEILVPNSGIAGMTVEDPKGGRYYTSTNPVHLSKLESCLKEARNGGGSAYVSAETPVLHEILEEVRWVTREGATEKEFHNFLVGRDLLWKKDDPRARPPPMWVEQGGKMDIKTHVHPDHPPSKRQRLL